MPHPAPGGNRSKLGEMPDRIPLTRPWLGDEEAAAVKRPLAAGWVMQGPEVEAFEQELATYVGAPHAVAVASGTAGLELALRVAGVGPGDEVITVSHSFVASANAIRFAGATPVFVDIEPATLNLDPRGLDAARSPTTKAILLVHQLGLPADLAAVLAWARAHRLPVIEDAACALGSEVELGAGWSRIGQPHGDLACFSFHPRKLVTTGDGGMVTTRNPDWDAALRRARNHGGMGLELGRNFRLTDLQAAVGRVQLGKLPALLERRRAQVGRYREALADRVGFPAPPASVRPNWQSLCVRLRSPVAPVLAGLAARGIASSPGIRCAHRLPVYATEPCRVAGSLAESERAEDESIMLPLYHELSVADQDRVIAALGELL
jgi:perosamine synthetase